MLRELVISPPGTGKTTDCIELFKNRILKTKAGIDSRSYFVLPSREHAARIQSLVLREVPGLFNAHILTIQDLADRLLGGAGGGRPTDSHRRAILQEALGAAGEDGRSLYGYFLESKSLGGFKDLLVESVREFKSGLLTIEDFEKRAQPLLRDPVFRSKFRDFSIVLRRYDAALEARGLAEAEDELLRSGLDAGRAPDLVIFDGFYHFTRFQRELLRQVSSAAAHTVVTLTLDDAHAAGDGLFGYPNRTRGFLLEMGFRERDPVRENRRTSNSALRHLAANLFSPEPGVFAGEAPVTVLSAPSRRVECEMIAREIRRLYREGPYHFSDICVILRSVSGRRALLESVFSEYDVPVSVHERNRLAESGLAMALHRFLRLFAEDWKREDVLYLAKSSYFRAAPPGPIALDEALDLERAALRENVSAGRGSWERLAAQEGLPSAAKRFLSGLFESESALRASTGPHAFASRVRAFFEPVLTLAGASELDAAAARAIHTVLAAALRREAPEFRVEDAVRELLGALEEGLFSLKHPGRNRVQVYNAVMALPKEYKVVFIADLLEKSFPQPVTEDPLFKDAERRAINGAGREEVLDERAWMSSGERYFFYMAVSRARERVYFTHSTHDEDGKPALASFFIDEALRCFAPEAVTRAAKGPSDFLPGPAEWETETDVSRGLAAFLRFPEASRPAFFAPLALRWRTNPAFERALAGRPVPGPVRLRDPRALEAMRTFAGPFSATGFDAFYKCAFRHFAESLLRLRRPPEGYEDAEIGNLLHAVLHDYFSGLPPAHLKSGDYWKEPQAMERELEALLEKRFRGAFGDQPLYRRAMFRQSMSGMLKGYVSLERRLAAEKGMTPFRFEYAFGKEGADYLRLADESGEILLKGSIDRIDVDAAGGRAVVIDYKKSSRGLKKKIEKGEEIQLPLYALAARRLLGLEPAGLEHRILRTGRSESPKLTPAELDALLADTESRVRDAVRRIRRGEIAVEPKECDFCPFDAVCRVDVRKDRRAF